MFGSVAGAKDQPLDRKKYRPGQTRSADSSSDLFLSSWAKWEPYLSNGNFSPGNRRKRYHDTPWFKNKTTGNARAYLLGLHTLMLRHVLRAPCGAHQASTTSTIALKNTYTGANINHEQLQSAGPLVMIYCRRAPCLGQQTNRQIG